MFKLLKYLRGYRAVSIAAPLFKLMEALFELIIPLVVARIIDVGIAGGDESYVIKNACLMVGLGVAGLLFSLTCQYLAAKASIGFGTNVRGALYRHINKLSYTELDKLGTASLVTRLNSDVNTAQTGVAMFIRLVLRAPFLVIGALIMAIAIDPAVSVIFVVMAVVVSVILYFIMTRSTPHYRAIQKGLDKISLLTGENLAGARVVRAFAGGDEESADFAEAAAKLSRRNIVVSLISGLINPLTYAVINLAIIAVLWFGGQRVYSGRLTAGQIIALVNYLNQILLALVVTANLAVTFTKAGACASRINEVLRTEPSIVSSAVACPAPVEGAPKIEFCDAALRYSGGGESVKGVSFSVQKGQTLGIIGSTGSGKSSLVHLLPRFYDVSRGCVKIDGVDVRDYPLHDLRKKIGLVPQKAALFSGTVRSNLLMGKPDATEEEMITALKIAQAYDFVEAGGGLDAEVVRGGRNFSGGQKQRLTVARAVIAQPEILILDDSASALDYATDSRLRKALGEMRGTTVVAVSQRYSGIRNAQRIVVMEDGAAAGIGTHDELLESCPVYREICSSQTAEASK